jgi:hypothetical protein
MLLASSVPSLPPNGPTLFAQGVVVSLRKRCSPSRAEPSGAGRGGAGRGGAGRGGAGRGEQESLVERMRGRGGAGHGGGARESFDVTEVRGSRG